jgi:hypothetical protein
LPQVLAAASERGRQDAVGTSAAEASLIVAAVSTSVVAAAAAVVAKQMEAARTRLEGGPEAAAVPADAASTHCGFRWCTNSRQLTPAVLLDAVPDVLGFRSPL